MFITQAPHVGAAIKQGSVILKSLFDDAKPRLEKLIAWSKSFKPDTDLNQKTLKAVGRNYCRSNRVKTYL